MESTIYPYSNTCQKILMDQNFIVYRIRLLLSGIRRCIMPPYSCPWMQSTSIYYRRDIWITALEWPPLPILRRVLLPSCPRRSLLWLSTRTPILWPALILIATMISVWLFPFLSFLLVTPADGSDFYAVLGSNDKTLSVYLCPGTCTNVLSTYYNTPKYSPIISTPLYICYLNTSIFCVSICCALNLFGGIGEDNILYLYTLKDGEFYRSLNLNTSKSAIESQVGSHIKSMIVKQMKITPRGYVILYFEMKYKHHHCHVCFLLSVRIH